MSHFSYPDPTNPGWTVVSYINPAHTVPSDPRRKAEFLEKRARFNLMRDSKMERARIRANDMHYAYVKTHMDHCRLWARRIRRDPKHALALAYEPEYFIYSPSDDQISSLGLLWCDGCERHVYPKHMTPILCTHCMDLPIPMSSSQNWNPVIIDKRTHGGEVLRGAYERMVRGRSGPRTTTGPAASKIEHAAEVGALAPPKQFTEDFIQRVVAARLKKGLTQETLAALINRKTADITLFERADLAFDPALKSQLMWKLDLA